MVKLGPKDALIVVDVQLDFLEGGALAVPDGNAIVDDISQLMRSSYGRAGAIVVTQDWHSPEHKSFADMHGKPPFSVVKMHGEDQVLWPVHCVAGSYGSRLHPDLAVDRATMILRKGMNPNVDSYSAFQENIGANSVRETTGLAALLTARFIENVYVCGLAADYCVRWTAIDANDAGFRSIILRDLTRAVYADTPEKRAKVLRDQEAADLFLQHNVFCTDSFES